MAFQY